jgi:toxin HigB-1
VMGGTRMIHSAKCHLTADRKGTWSLTVTKNWRMTFWVNAEGNIEDLDLEDYR